MGDEAADVELEAAPEIRAVAAAVLERVSSMVRRASVARYGTEVGGDAAADAIAWAWEHGRTTTSMENPGGYLYSSTSHSRWRSHWSVNTKSRIT